MTLICMHLQFVGTKKKLRRRRRKKSHRFLSYQTEVVCRDDTYVYLKCVNFFFSCTAEMIIVRDNFFKSNVFFFDVGRLERTVCNRICIGFCHRQQNKSFSLRDIVHNRNISNIEHAIQVQEKFSINIDHLLDCDNRHRSTNISSLELR